MMGYDIDPNNVLPQWAEGLDCAVTVCDSEGIILYMNERSRTTFAKYGDIIGHSLFEYHPERACEIIRRLLRDGASNTYSISKNGVKKIIHQTPWRLADGSVGGLVEISMVVPEEMPHYVRESSNS